MKATLDGKPPIDELPFLDTDIARAAVLLTRETFVFFLHEFDITLNYPLLDETRFVSIQFIEIGGDHLDLLMAPPAMLESLPEATRTIRGQSWDLLTSAQKTAYFVNTPQLLPQRKMSLESRDSCKWSEQNVLCVEALVHLLQRIRFLSRELFPPGHEIVFILSRLDEVEGCRPGDSKDDEQDKGIDFDIEAFSTQLMEAVHELLSESVETDGDADNLIGRQKDILDTKNAIRRTFLQLCNQQRVDLVSTQVSPSSSPLSSPTLSSTSSSALRLSLVEVIMCALTSVIRCLEWPCVVVDVHPGSQLIGKDLNPEGILQTLSSMFGQGMIHCVGDPRPLAGK